MVTTCDSDDTPTSSGVMSPAQSTAPMDADVCQMAEEEALTSTRPTSRIHLIMFHYLDKYTGVSISIIIHTLHNTFAECRSTVTVTVTVAITISITLFNESTCLLRFHWGFSSLLLQQYSTRAQVNSCSLLWWYSPSVPTTVEDKPSATSNTLEQDATWPQKEAEHAQHMQTY